MYITDVIKRVDEIYPNEFSFEMKVKILDSLTENLGLNYKKTYKSEKLSPALDNTYLLPIDAEWERVESVRFKGRELKKENLTTYGVRLSGTYDNLQSIRVDGSGGGEIEVIYLALPEPVRIIEIPKHVYNVTESGFYIEKCPLIKGDIIEIEEDEGKRTLNVFNITLPDSDSDLFFVDCGDGAFVQSGEAEFSIERLICEKTLCSAPYDEMYVYYLLARLSLYQRAFTVYSIYNDLFQSLLEKYSRYVFERREEDKYTKWRGF